MQGIGVSGDSGRTPTPGRRHRQTHGVAGAGLTTGSRVRLAPDFANALRFDVGERTLSAT